MLRESRNAMNISESAGCSRSMRTIVSFSILTNDRVRHGGSRGYVQRLTGKASFAKEIARARHRDDPLLTVLGYYGKLYVALFDVEDRIGGISLQEDACLWAVLCSGPSGSHRCEE